jgi:hypothetical protein
MVYGPEDTPQCNFKLETLRESYLDGYLSKEEFIFWMNDTRDRLVAYVEPKREWKHLQMRYCQCAECNEQGRFIMECCLIDGKWIGYPCYEETDHKCSELIAQEEAQLRGGSNA